MIQLRFRDTRDLRELRSGLNLVLLYTIIELNHLLHKQNILYEKAIRLNLTNYNVEGTYFGFLSTWHAIPPDDRQRDRGGLYLG